MGTTQSTQETKSSQSTQETKYTQVTIKDLNNIIDNNKLKLELKPDREKEQQTKDEATLISTLEELRKNIVKEYLYKIDLGKLLIEAANLNMKKVNIFKNTDVLIKNKDNTYIVDKFRLYSESNIKEHIQSLAIFIKNKNNTYVVENFGSFIKNILIFDTDLLLLLDDYKIFVKDVLKIDVDITIQRIANYDHYGKHTTYYQASWD
jgi:hypothetical protein